jgi:TfoX/Sxy family transcriptional regulator of competence genes
MRATKLRHAPTENARLQSRRMIPQTVGVPLVRPHQEDRMPVEKGSLRWERTSDERTEHFRAVLARHPEIVPRKMFGEAAGFVNGNLVTGLHAGGWFVRLKGDVRTEALALPGARLFEPMPGRPMGDYIVLPPEVVADEAALDGWLERAIATGRALKPK